MDFVPITYIVNTLGGGPLIVSMNMRNTDRKKQFQYLFENTTEGSLFQDGRHTVGVTIDLISKLQYGKKMMKKLLVN